MNHILAAVAAGLLALTVLSGTPTVDTAPTLGAAVATQHSAVQAGIDTAQP